jgi:hypothetical protein
MLALTSTIDAVALTYVSNPRWRAFIWLLPLPLSVAVLAVGRPIDATNILGMALTLFFIHSVCILHYNLRLWIVPSIALSEFAYCFIGWNLARIVPPTNGAFWLAVGVTVAVTLAATMFASPREEKSQRSVSPLWIKLPVIVAIVFFLVAMKRGLGGFMSTCPIVGTIMAYESRKCLASISRASPLGIWMMLLFLVTAHATQKSVGLGPSLIIAWGVFLGAYALRSGIQRLFASKRTVLDAANIYEDQLPV